MSRHRVAEELEFIRSPRLGRVFGREELLDLVWGRDGFVEPRTVDVHLARMRGKFLAARLTAPAVETVRGLAIGSASTSKRNLAVTLPSPAGNVGRGGWRHQKGRRA